MKWDSDHIRIAKNAAWTSAKIGNSTEAEYYTRAEAGNPSGNKNLKRLIHKDGNGRVVFVINYEWDADDDFLRDYATQNA